PVTTATLPFRSWSAAMGAVVTALTLATVPDMAASDATLLDELGRRLARIEDERGVLDTLYRYGHSIDHGPDDEWLDCFTQDGVWDSIPGPEISDRASRITRRGRAELAAFI